MKQELQKWLPEGKAAAICFTIDDVHPGKSSDAYEAGGDLNDGALGRVNWLLKRHPELKTTLFTTACWREISPHPTRWWIKHIPILKDKFYWSKVLDKQEMRLTNNLQFVQYLNRQKQMEVACHGLYHAHKGARLPVEFQNQSTKRLDEMITEMLAIFNKSGIDYERGFCPPGWNAPANLLSVLKEKGFQYIASARDLFTPIKQDAMNNMSGMKDVSIIKPTLLENGLIHFPTNFQANSTLDRARQIMDCHGLLSIKAHIVKKSDYFTAIDGVNELYMNYLDTLFTVLKNEYGDKIWWTSMREMSQFINQTNTTL